MADDTPHYVDIETLQEWSDNYNQGDVQAIARFILRYGFNGSLSVWRDQVVMVGNHRLKALRLLKELGPAEAAQRLGFVAADQDPTEVTESLAWLHWPPRNVIEQDGRWRVLWVDVSHLDEGEAVGYAIADNRSVQLATHDEARLAGLLVSVRDELGLSVTGYDDDAVRLLLAAAKAAQLDPDAYTFSDADLDGIGGDSSESPYQNWNLAVTPEQKRLINAWMEQVLDVPAIAPSEQKSAALVGHIQAVWEGWQQYV